ncbi:MAG: polar amino acid transport system substrate-binding protein [Enterobacterales bacterium]|jgi:polar amino acid transport system substrate-binding protein
MLTIQRTFLFLFIATLFLTGCDNSTPPKPEVKTKATEVASAPEKVIAKTQTIAAESCELTMGWEPWAPYHYQEYGEQVKGLDIEMMDMITAETGCKISYQKGDWKVLLHLLKMGEIDLLTGASINDKRKKYATFSDGYRTESFQLYVRAGEVSKFEGYNMKELINDGFRLGITMDYIYNDEVNSLQDNPENDTQIIAVSTGLINYSKLSEGDIDGFLEDPVVGSSSIRRQGLEDQIELHPYIINTGDVHVMFSKASVNEETINSFNRALGIIRADGRHKKLMNKYTK